ncbi:hypothetical protein ASE08_26840 [Rhizobacter sp. Root16D2]|nr:hypothetical protein ASE08_26840 [Rhizobacter sp. Root16D2]
MPIGRLDRRIQLQIPLALVGRVAIDDQVIHHPHLLAATESPDDQLPAVALHVHADRELHRATRHGAQWVPVLAAQREPAGVSLLQLLLVGLAARGIDEGFEVAVVAGLRFLRGGQPVAHDADPGRLRAVRGPAEERHVLGRSHLLVRRVAEAQLDRVTLVDPKAAMTTVDRPPTAAPNCQVLSLRDASAAMRTDMAHGLRIAVGPLEAVPGFLATPLEGVLLVAVRAANEVLEAHVGLVLAVLDQAEALQLRRAARHRFRERGALYALVAQPERAALLLDIAVEPVGLVVVDAVDRDAAVVLRGLATTQVELASAS